MFAAFPHLAAQRVALTAWVQLAAVAANAATCHSSCGAALEGRPCLQRQYTAAAALLQRLTAAAPLAAAAPAAAVPWHAAAGMDAAVRSCCSIRVFAWLGCSCCLSLWLLHRREAARRLAWARQQRGPARRLVLPLQGALLPRWASAAELLVGLSLAWHVSALLLTPLVTLAASPSFPFL